MKLIITDSIREFEFLTLQGVFNLNVIKASALKALKGLGDTIKNSSKIVSTVLKKVYITSSGGAGRAIFLLQTPYPLQKAVLVMIRLKSEKHVGVNMTVKNPHFKKLLDRNLDLILEDIKYRRFREYELE